MYITRYIGAIGNRILKVMFSIIAVWSELES